MANQRGKAIDKTHLSIDQAEKRGFIHRDYIAHCMRWSHVVKRMMERGAYKDARVLDIGCGREAPLGRLFYSSKMMPAKYMGVDIGPIDNMDYGSYSNRVELWEHEDFCEMDEKVLLAYKPTHIVSFEMLEHIEPLHCLRVLRRIRSICVLARVDPQIFISTPCWNRTDCAGNHVNEITYEALGSLFEREMFHVKFVHGTFASQSDYVQQMDPHVESVFERLREYYDSNFISCVFAPLYPAQSRNCLWELQCRVSTDKREANKFKPLNECIIPWSSSMKWEEFTQ